MLFRTVRSPTFARVIDPTHDVVVVGFLPDLCQISRESAPNLAVALADGMTSQTSSRFEKFFAMLVVTFRLRRHFTVEAVLPEISRDCFQIVRTLFFVFSKS